MSETVEELKPCPFCGSDAKLIERGNNYSKERFIEIKCVQCRAMRIDGAIHHSMEWLKQKSIEQWNKRKC